MEYNCFVILMMSLCFCLGLSAGIIMYRSDFCMAGMFRDLFLFQHTFMLKTFLLLVVTTMVLFEGARLCGLLPIYPFPLLYSPTPANLIGGFLFGVGMVLAGGCVIGTLYKMGSGSILSAITFVGLVTGSAAYAEIYPLWASFIKETTFFPGKITLPQVLGVEPTVVIGLVVAVSLFLLLRWRQADGLVRRSYAEGYLQPWKAAVLLSFVGLLSYVLTGMPLGVTSSYAKIAAYAEALLFGQHIRGLSYFSAVPLKYIHPISGIGLQGGVGPVFDAFSIIQFPLIAGVVLGSAISALKLKEFKVRFGAPARQRASALAGGLIMGFSSRMAPTCNVWHLMGGLPILAVSSLLFAAGLLPGAWLGSRLLVRVVMTDRQGA